MNAPQSADEIVLVTFWKRHSRWTYNCYMPRSWIERAMVILGGVEWRVGR